MNNLLDHIKPCEIDNKESTNSISLTDKIKQKRNLLQKYITNPNSTNEDFKSIIEEYGDDIPYTVNESMEYLQCNYNLFPKINRLINTNHSILYNKKLGPYLLNIVKENNINNYTFSKVNRYKLNPYYKDGISNSEFNEIWKLLKDKYIDLRDSDLELICKLYTIEELKYMVGYNSDRTKSKLTKNEKKSDNKLNESIDVNFIPKTKGEMYSYWYNYCKLYNLNFPNMVLGNINTNNMDDLLKDVKVIFLASRPSIEDERSKSLFINSTEANRLRLVIKGLQLQSKDYICLNICLTNNNFTKEMIQYSYVNVFSKLLEVLPKNCIIVPTDEIVYKKILGCTNNTYYKYGKRYISSIFIIKNPNSINELYNWIFTEQKKPSVKRENTINDNSIINNLEMLSLEDDDNNTNININNKVELLDNIEDKDLMNLNDITSTNFQYSNHIYSLKEFEEVLKELDGYSIMYISRSIYTSKKNITEKRGTPYIVLRKGDDKRFYFINPEILVGVSILQDAKVEEPLNRLITFENVKFKDLYKVKREIEDDLYNRYNVKPKFYNTDFSPTVYISSYIRNRYKYKEGIESPRIAVIDFETEKSATKVKYSSNSINSKVRLMSYLDVKYKTFYCCVLKDNKYHKDIDLSNITKHDGYKVVIDEYEDEIDLWKWLNQKIYDLDPDIITGWNVNNFDLTYAIVRCKTLGITFKSKYGEFKIIEVNDRKRKRYDVGVDGIVILDYKYLFQKCSLKKYEKYKLEFICQEILKHGKRPMIDDDHDNMYHYHLIEYLLYNIEDDERIMELEDALNYIRFNFEICNVCNISWDEIFNKTKLIDGLVYNHAWDSHRSLIKGNTYGRNSENINIYQFLLDNLRFFINSNNIDTIDNGKINLREYVETTVVKEIEEKDSDDDEDEDTYEGATVLLPQMGVYNILADLDASQMYPRIMIRCNIFKDTLCGIIAYDNENMAEKWIYDNENFPSEIPIQILNNGVEEIKLFSKEQFREYLKDKILTPYGTIFWSTKVKRSILSDILIWLIKNRNEYKKLMDDATEEYTKISNIKGIDDPESIHLDIIRIKYSNLQMAYKQLINSIYGGAGTKGYKLNDPFSAASITACGRELTRIVAHFSSTFMDKMIELKNEDIDFNSVSLNFKTVQGFEDIKNRRNALYGDTDSSMFWIGKVIDGIYGNNISLDDKINHAWNIIDKVSKFINEYIIKFLLEKKNIDFNDEDKNYNYEYKKEWVCENIIFGTQKKQYAMHMVMRNGKRLDKIEIVGMTIIKSDTPRFAREFGSEIVNYILRDYDSNDIEKSNEILKEKYNKAVIDAKKLMDEGSILIAKPISIKDIADYKNINSNQRGMMIYDLLYDHEYMYGDKGYQFDISEIDYEKLGISKLELKKAFKEKYSGYNWYENFSRTCSDALLFSSITIPVDFDRLDTSIFKINKEKMIETSLKSKVSTLYDIVGISALDDKDRAKLKRSGIMKFDINDPMFTI